MPTQPPPPSNPSSPTPKPQDPPVLARPSQDLVPKQPDPQDPGKPTGFLTRDRDEEGKTPADYAREEAEAQLQDLEDAKIQAQESGQDPNGDWVITEGLPAPFFMVRRYRGVGPLAYETSRGLLKVNSGELIVGFFYHLHDEAGNDLEEELREYLVMGQDAFMALQDDLGPDDLPESLDVRAIRLGAKRRGDPVLKEGDSIDDKKRVTRDPRYRKGTVPEDRELRPGERPRANFKDTPALGVETPPGATIPKPPAPPSPGADLRNPPTTTSSSAT